MTLCFDVLISPGILSSMMASEPAHAQGLHAADINYQGSLYQMNLNEALEHGHPYNLHRIVSLYFLIHFVGLSAYHIKISRRRRQLDKHIIMLSTNSDLACQA